jgi:hypothetical protein
MDTVTADKTHRGHAIIEQVNADLKNSALARLPSGVYTANAAWLVCAVIAFNLTRAAAILTGDELAKATTGTVRRELINIATRLAASARRITLHLPIGSISGQRCSTRPADNPPPRPDHHAEPRPNPTRSVEQSRSEAGPSSTPGKTQHHAAPESKTQLKPIGGSRLSAVHVA